MNFHIKNVTETHFDLFSDEERVGYLSFSKDEAHFYLNYVYVSPRYRGQGIGQVIVKYAIELANQAQLKPVGVCGYARSVMSGM